jgi:dipeptidyl-peptidase-3
LAFRPDRPFPEARGIPVQRILILFLMLVLAACGKEQAPTEPDGQPDAAAEESFEVSVDRFADIELLRYEVPGFDELSLREKKLAFYLSQAALAGRDIIYDQNYEHNLRIRKLLAAIVGTYSGDREAEDFKKLLEYAKRVWFAHGIHHHYSMDKMLPEFTPEALIAMVAKSDESKLPLDEGQTRGELLDMLRPVMFDPDVAAKKVTLDPDVDQVVNSATNYYSGVTANDVEKFYSSKVDDDPERPVSWGLNSQLAKVDGEVVERVWKIGGMYGPAIEKIVSWLEKASTVAENDTQKAWIDKLVEYYRTGDLRDFDEFNIAWVADAGSHWDIAVPGSLSYLSAISRQPSVLQRLVRTHNGSKITRRSWTNTRKTMLSAFPRRSLPWSCRAET